MVIVFAGSVFTIDSPAFADVSVETLIFDVIKQNYGSLSRCTDRLHAIDRDRGGTVFVEVSVNEIGQIDEAKVIRSEIKEPMIHDCLLEEVHRWRFPKTNGLEPNSAIVIPLTFPSKTTQFIVDERDARAAISDGENQPIPLLSARNVGADRALLSLIEIDRDRTMTLDVRHEQMLYVISGNGVLSSVATEKKRVKSHAITEESLVWLFAESQVSLRTRDRAMKALLVTLTESAPTNIVPWIVFDKRSRRTLHLFNDRLHLTPFVDTSSSDHRRCYLGKLVAEAGLKMPAHRHEKEAEIVYVLEGRGEMRFENQTQTIRAGDATFIPVNAEHAFDATERMTVLQIYVPSGPEQRFFKLVETLNQRRKGASR